MFGMERTVNIFSWTKEFIVNELKPSMLDSSEFLNSTLQKILEEGCRIKKRLYDVNFEFIDQPINSVIIHRYYNVVVFLINDVYNLTRLDYTKNRTFAVIASEMLVMLQDVYFFISSKFSKVLGYGVTLPITDLIKQSYETSARLNTLLNSLRSKAIMDDAIECIRELFEDYISSLNNGQLATRGEINYYSLLMNDLINYPIHDYSISSKIFFEEVLIYWNVNSEMCFRYLTKRIVNNASSFESINSEIYFLKFQFNLIKLLPVNPGVSHTKHQMSLKDYIINHLKSEIFLRVKLSSNFFNNPVNIASKNEIRNNKVKLRLSADQIGLILRAASSSGVIEGSVNAIFKLIVPYLSSLERENLSWSSMRGSSYEAESRDVRIAVEALENVKSKLEKLPNPKDDSDKVMELLSQALLLLSSHSFEDDDIVTSIDSIQEVIKQLQSF
jgi:hypothetical protein